MRSESFVAAIVAVALAAAGCAAEEDKPGSGKAGADSSQEDCGNRATDDCTPHVGPNDTVRVDALLWTVKDVRTAASIGDPTYGLDEKADGVYVVADLGVKSDRNESADLTDSMIQLEVNGNTYDVDSDGSFAASLNGKEPFIYESIGPDSKESGTVVFDVPKKVLKNKMELRFGELGFGETHGYIELPAVG